MDNLDKTTPSTRITLDTLQTREASTAQRNLQVRTGIRAGADGTTHGRFARYSGNP